MNNEIKVGDKVRVSKDAPKVYLSSVNNLFKYHVCKVDETDGDSAIIRYADIGIDLWLAIPTKYLIKVDPEAKEPRFKVGDRVSVKASEILDGGVFTIIGMELRGKQGWAYELNIHEWHPESRLEPYTGRPPLNTRKVTELKYVLRTLTDLAVSERY